MKSWRVAVVVPARGVKWLSRPTAATCSTGRPRTSAVIEQREEVCPPPTSGARKEPRAKPPTSCQTQPEPEQPARHCGHYAATKARRLGPPQPAPPPGAGGP